MTFEEMVYNKSNAYHDLIVNETITPDEKAGLLKFMVSCLDCAIDRKDSRYQMFVAVNLCALLDAEYSALGDEFSREIYSIDPTSQPVKYFKYSDEMAKLLNAGSPTNSAAFRTQLSDMLLRNIHKQRERVHTCPAAVKTEEKPTGSRLNGSCIFHRLMELEKCAENDAAKPNTSITFDDVLDAMGNKNDKKNSYPINYTEFMDRMMELEAEYNRISENYQKPCHEREEADKDCSCCRKSMTAAEPNPWLLGILMDFE